MVWIRCSSKKTSIPNAFRSLTASSSVTVFRAKREMDLVMIISTVPFRQSANSRWNSGLASFVPV